MKLTQRHPVCSNLRGLAFAAAALVALPAQAQRRHDTLSQVPIFELPAPLFRGSGAFGDFDGDQAADLAVADALPVQGATYRYRIGVRLTAQSNTAFDVETRIVGGLRLS